MQCELCRREIRAKSGSLCRYHQEALESLRAGYEAWNAAYSGIAWEVYLDKVKTLQDTGEWIKEVIVLEEGML